MSTQDEGLMSIHVEEHEVFEDEDATPPVAGEKPKDQVRVKHDKYGKPIPYFDPNYAYILYDCHGLPEELLDGTPIIVKPTAHLNFKQIMALIEKDIKSKEPMMLTLACFDHLIPQMTTTKLMEGVRYLSDLAHQANHYFSTATQLFIPNKPHDWFRKAQINAELRALNIDNDVPPFSLHKCVMKPLYETYGPLTCQGRMWNKFLNGTGLGSTLSSDGLEKIAHFSFLALGLQFEDIDRNESRRWIGLPIPVQLCLTANYTNNPEICQILRDRNLHSIRRMSGGGPQQPREQQPVEQQAPPPQQGAQGNDRDLVPIQRPTYQDTASNTEISNSIQGELYNKDAVDELKERYRRQITSLNNDISNYQASEENQYKKISKYKDEVNKLKSEKETLNTCIENCKITIQNQLERISLLKDQYSFLKRIHENKEALIREEWGSMVDTLKKGNVDLSDHFNNITPEMSKDLMDVPTPKDKKHKRKGE